MLFWLYWLSNGIPVLLFLAWSFYAAKKKLPFLLDWVTIISPGIVWILLAESNVRPKSLSNLVELLIIQVTLFFLCLFIIFIRCTQRSSLYQWWYGACLVNVLAFVLYFSVPGLPE
jgi:hypothetical protein